MHSDSFSHGANHLPLSFEQQMFYGLHINTRRRTGTGVDFENCVEVSKLCDAVFQWVYGNCKNTGCLFLKLMMFSGYIYHFTVVANKTSCWFYCKHVSGSVWMFRLCDFLCEVLWQMMTAVVLTEDMSVLEAFVDNLFVRVQPLIHLFWKRTFLMRHIYRPICAYFYNFNGYMIVCL